ncbi:MAG: protein kinase [Desmonostoc vinosum HA7617-LM4]|jgi:serine/threonine-protein kinase|nr:protein kinase [Desmonostoc vinosum HA7617-LM4]
MIGQIIGGRYQIIEVLGKGGFGVTFTAIDTGRPGNPRCVVKQFKPVSTDSYILQVGKRLFDTEAEKLERLGNHDRIPRLLAYFQEQEEFYLVQEYIEGHDLSRELISGTQLSEAYVVKLLLDILEVLVFVHQQNLIHRDLKPSNIRRRQIDGQIVLIDFGAVKEITTQVVNSQGQPLFTVPIGTGGYIPSEQAKGQPTFCSDIYAVGMIAIQALTGLNPALGELTTHPQTGEIVWRDRAQVSPKLANIIDKMVRYDYRQRYQSADEVLQAIKAISPKFPPKKLWLGVGILAVITPLVLWIFYQSTNSKPTLATYENRDSGITIKYPENWKLKKTGDDFGELIKFVPKNQKQTDSCLLEVTVNISDLPEQLLSLNEYKNLVLQRIKNNSLNQQIIDASQPETTLSKFNAYKLIYTRQEQQCNLKVMEIGTVRNGNAYYITYTAEINKYPQFLPTVEEIVNSLQIMQVQ